MNKIYLAGQRKKVAENLSRDRLVYVKHLHQWRWEESNIPVSARTVDSLVRDNVVKIDSFGGMSEVVRNEP